MAEAVPEQDPHWDFNTPGDILAREQLMTCLLSGLLKAALTPVNCDKLLEGI